jgi:hypothetical protein
MMKAKTLEVHFILTGLIARDLLVENVLPVECLEICATFVDRLHFELNIHDKSFRKKVSILKVC